MQNDQDEFIGPRPPSPEFLEKMRKQEQRRDRVNDFVRDKVLRDKQEERKRRAEMLVQQLKSKTNESSTTIHSDEPSSNPTINPTLVEKLLNVKTERSSSSMITSPPRYSHRSKHSPSPSKPRSLLKSHRRSRSRSSHRQRRRRSSHKYTFFSPFSCLAVPNTSCRRSRSRSKSRSHHRSKKSKK